MSNENLAAALKNKNDEFYTLYEDVEKECSQYDFSGKVVWLPTDDEESSFWQYFSSNYDKLGLKGLFATHIQPDNSYMLVGGDVPQRVVPLDFNGDFFSENCDFLWKQIDIVITNPLFSLYREFVKTILAHEKQFLLIGNENSTASRDLFPLFKGEQIHYGYNNVKQFVRADGERQTFSNISWFTNLPTKKSNCFVPTNTAPETDFQHYENYDAINIDRVKDIPTHCSQIMGVPITYLKKHNPERYEILGLASGISRREKLYGEVPYTLNTEDHGGNPMIDGKRKYSRIFIREKEVK